MPSSGRRFAISPTAILKQGAKAAAERHRETPSAGHREIAIVPSRSVLPAVLLLCLVGCARKKRAEIGVSTRLTWIYDGHTRHATLGLGTGSSIHAPARSIVTFIW